MCFFLIFHALRQKQKGLSMSDSYVDGCSQLLIKYLRSVVTKTQDASNVDVVETLLTEILKNVRHSSKHSTTAPSPGMEDSTTASAVHHNPDDDDDDTLQHPKPSTIFEFSSNSGDEAPPLSLIDHGSTSHARRVEEKTRDMPDADGRFTWQREEHKQALKERRLERQASLFDQEIVLHSDVDALLAANGNRFTIPPGNRFKASWDVFLCLAVLYIAIAAPLRLAFEVDTTPLYVQIFDAILDLAFIFDIALSFVTGFIDPATKDAITCRSIIAHRYATSWLALDVVSGFPTELLELLSYNNIGSLRLFKLVKVLKIGRLFRLMRLEAFRDLELSRHTNPSLIRMGKFLSAFGFILHFSACAYWAVARWEGFGGDSVWVPEEDFLELPLYDQYSKAFYFAMSSMLGNHMEPRSPVELRFSALIQFVGLVVNATVIGSAASLLSNLNAVAVQKKKEMDAVEQYMAFRKVPQTLQNEIKDYYEYLWSCGQDAHNDDLFQNLPHSLGLKLRLSLSRSLIERVPMFRKLEPNAVVALVLRMETAIAIPDEVVIREGQIGTAMYFINRGLVYVSVRNSRGERVEIATLKVGSYFGEIALMDRRQTASATVTAMAYCELYRLGYAQWEEVSAQFPSLGVGLESMAKNRYTQMQNVKNLSSTKMFGSGATPSPFTSSSSRRTSQSLHAGGGLGRRRVVGGGVEGRGGGG